MAQRDKFLRAFLQLEDSDKTIHILNDIEYGGDIVDIRNIGDLSRELKTELLEEDFVKRLGLSAQIHFCGVDTMLSD